MRSFFRSILIFILLIPGSCNEPKQEVLTLDITEFKLEDAGKGVLVDVRTPEEFSEGHLPGAVNINVLADDFKEKVGELKKRKPVYLYCKAGTRSKKASVILDSLDFRHIYNLDGGFNAWEGAGNRVEK